VAARTLLDRLPAIDDDIADMAAKLESAPASNGASASAVAQVSSGRERQEITCRHSALKKFEPGKPVIVEIESAMKAGSARLNYRRVTQASDGLLST